AVDSHGLGGALRDQLRHALAHRGGDLEAGAAEGRREIQTVHALHRAEDGVTVTAVAVEGAIAAGERGALHERDAMGEDARAHARRLGRQAGPERVGIYVPLLAGHADEREPARFRSEIA